LRASVVGYGSIGRRHARILDDLGVEVAVVSRRFVSFTPHYSDLTIALSDWQPDYVIVANETSLHEREIETLIRENFEGSVLVEKPLFDQVHKLPDHRFSLAAVAYNLRCHPLLKRLKLLLDDASNLITANIYVGSYLPDWRPNSDYRQTYSAKSALGGGVLRDLSHELDYALWLFGSWQRLTAFGGHLSSLEIDSDDAYTLLMETQHCPMLSIHMNYLDRAPRREISVTTDEHTIRVNLIENTIEIDGNLERIIASQDDTYIAEHKAVFSGNPEDLCSFEEGMETLATIEAAELSASSHTWVTR